MINQFIQSLSSIPFFSSAWFGVGAMVIVGGSWCLIGLVMGDAPKRGIEPSLVQLFGNTFSVALSIVIMFATGGVPQCSWRVTLVTCGVYAVAGMMNFFMLQIMAYAMQRGPNGIIWAIIQSALIFPFLGGVIFFGVELTLPRLGGILFLLAALALFGMAKNNSENGGRWRLLAFICLAICAVQQNLMTAPSYCEEARAIGSIVRSLSVAGGGLAGAILYNLARMNGERRAQLRGNLLNPVLWKYIGALQFFNLIFAYTLFYPGMNAMADAGLGGMCYPMMVGSCIITFTLSSVWLLKERVRPLQLAALAVCITGLILLCIPAR
ncbi:MAG: hypothetical protein HPZ91_11390 [Lentisphaeria bacterium]|nr:hypothetical protein [Lentisphaeria bacterium]